MGTTLQSTIRYFCALAAMLGVTGLTGTVRAASDEAAGQLAMASTAGATQLTGVQFASARPVVLPPAPQSAATAWAATMPANVLNLPAMTRPEPLSLDVLFGHLELPSASVAQQDTPAAIHAPAPPVAMAGIGLLAAFAGLQVCRSRRMAIRDSATS